MAEEMNDSQCLETIESYFLELWRLNSKAAAANFESDAEVTGAVQRLDDQEDDEEKEEIPTEIDTMKCSGGFSVVGPDKLSVCYPKENLHGHDVGVVQSNRPAPSKRLVYYFEIFVKNAGAKGQIAIGFTTSGFKMCRQPGWEANSYGYHGDDGLLYRGHGKGEVFGPTYTAGDTVGGGINYASQELFFTKNGTIVGTVLKDVKAPLFPTVAVHSQNEEVSVNFGKDPFVFDLKAYEAQERAKQQATLEKITLPQNASHGIVRSYLQHYGYEDTLQMFDIVSKSTIPPISFVQENGPEEDSMYALNHRKILRQLIRSGQIDDAFRKLQDWYPSLVQDGSSAICFLLHCQKFIELARAGKLEEAVNHGRSKFHKFIRFTEFEDLVKDCATLLAFEQPLKCPAGYLLGDTQREIVADAVNAVILSQNPKATTDQRACLHSCLERLLRQLTACFLERRAMNGDQGEGFHLRRILYTNGKKEV